ncbi:MAG: hypothetical protein L0Y60_10830 [Beijerinckiaceae bacterium]|nr:hypothetical protein [Beijerinckiaceae bacterium]
MFAGTNLKIAVPRGMLRLGRYSANGSPGWRAVYRPLASFRQTAASPER